MYIIKQAKVSTTWETLAKASEDGKLDKILGEGDMIPITLKDGSKHRIVHTKDDMGRRFFLFVNCVAAHRMNSTHTNEGGWEKSEMRGWLNTEWTKMLPDDLRDVIKPTEIKQIINGKTIISHDLLWLPSEYQVNGKEIYAGIEPDAAQIKWFKTWQNRFKTREGSASDWWLRSPTSGASYYFCSVISDGSANYYSAGYSRGVSPGFVI